MIVVEETHSKPINVPGVLPLNAAITDYGYERGTAEFSAHLSTRITLKSNTINSLSNVFRPVPFLFAGVRNTLSELCVQPCFKRSAI